MVMNTPTLLHNTHSFVDMDNFLELCHNPSSAPGPLAAPESLWRIDDGLAETVHMLQPIGNSYTSVRRPSHVTSFQRGEDETVYV